MKQKPGTSGKWRVNEPHRSQKRQPRVGTNEQELLPTAGASTNAQRPAVGVQSPKEGEDAPEPFAHPGLPATGPKAINPLPKAGAFRPFTPSALADALKAHADGFSLTEPTGILTLEVLSSLAGSTKGAVDVVQMAAAIRVANALLQSFGF